MIRILLILIVIFTCASCDDSTSPASLDRTSSVAGSVVFDKAGLPAAGVDVVLERCANGSMMGGDDWNMLDHMQTDDHGRFHFEYHHTSMHRYRVGVADLSDRHPCDGGFDDNVVLRIPQ